MTPGALHTPPMRNSISRLALLMAGRLSFKMGMLQLVGLAPAIAGERLTRSYAKNAAMVRSRLDSVMVCSSTRELPSMWFE